MKLIDLSIFRVLFFTNLVSNISSSVWGFAWPGLVLSYQFIRIYYFITQSTIFFFEILGLCMNLYRKPTNPCDSVKLIFEILHSGELSQSKKTLCVEHLNLKILSIIWSNLDNWWRIFYNDQATKEKDTGSNCLVG